MPILGSSSNVCSHARQGCPRVRCDSCHGRVHPVSPSPARPMLLRPGLRAERSACSMSLSPNNPSRVQRWSTGRTSAPSHSDARAPEPLRRERRPGPANCPRGLGPLVAFPKGTPCSCRTCSERGTVVRSAPSTKAALAVSRAAAFPLKEACPRIPAPRGDPVWHRDAGSALGSFPSSQTVSGARSREHIFSAPKTYSLRTPSQRVFVGTAASSYTHATCRTVTSYKTADVHGAVIVVNEAQKALLDRLRELVEEIRESGALNAAGQLGRGLREGRLPPSTGYRRPSSRGPTTDLRSSSTSGRRCTSRPPTATTR
jgi:hypothetical protein